MDLELYNTLGRSLQHFVPLESGRVGIYACGPTVYNYAHIGNLRTYIFEDVLRRVLEYLGYRVEHVMNITDVGHLTDDADSGEDKMLKSAREKAMSPWDLAEMYTKAFFKDTARLNIINPTIVCKATDHIPEMIDLVRRLEQRGHTYESGGNIYFSIDTFPGYGRLALLDRQELKAGARVKVDQGKKNPHDFVLWFTKSKFENQVMLWDSPWGRGYPGWHLECSAMSMKYLGATFDIHCGGIDHISVHHTNEIAQSEAATGRTWVNYWLHGEFLLLDSGKMSKSKGGFLTLDRLIEEGFDPLDYRYFCLAGHYRSQITFNFDSLRGAQSARRNLVERLRALPEANGSKAGPSAKAREYLDAFTAHAAADLNMPRCLATLWDAVKDDELTPGDKLALAVEMDRVLGLDLLSARKDSLDTEIEALIKEREAARRDRNFSRADEIRDELKGRGIYLEDTPQGTHWKRV